MSDSLWTIRTSELLARSASSEPTPGGGSVAAICGALGVSLMQMAISVTADDSLDHFAARLGALQTRIVPAADSDVVDFEKLMSAYRLPHSDGAEQRERQQALESASVRATEGPLALVAALVEALDLAHQLEPVVKSTVVSDVLAGRDIVIGAARAAIHTADLNIRQLQRLASSRASELQTLRDELAHRIGDAA